MCAMSRMCGNDDGTVLHILCSCSKLAQVQYKKRHDTLGQVVQWGLCRKYNIGCTDKWYEHALRKVEENEEVKILWDFNIKTDREIHHRRPDIVAQRRKERRTIIVDIAIPGDRNVDHKEIEKREKYQDLAREIGNLWKTRTKVVPVVVGALSSAFKQLKYHLEQIGIPDKKSIFKQQMSQTQIIC